VCARARRGRGRGGKRFVGEECMGGDVWKRDGGLRLLLQASELGVGKESMGYLAADGKTTRACYLVYDYERVLGWKQGFGR
jgi:hypothetical protein